MVADDTGREFEQRAIAVARAKHDPSGIQGAVEFEGAEHDGAFIDETSINVYEFTTLRTKEKALKDGAKIARLLKHLLSEPKNRYKSATGYFVTQQEPEIEQKKAIESIAKSQNVTLHCMSFLTLQKGLVDVERYIELRRNAPFGSTVARLAVRNGREGRDYVEPTFREVHGGAGARLDDVIARVAESQRVVISGDFGIGKSAALREVFGRLRRAYFHKPDERRFPIHINLRDCIGLKSPREILQRHAEDIGFVGSNGLIAAWRAGQAVLLLDGFDELIPARWVGSARDLKSIRWQTLAPIRQMIADTPITSAVVVVGRPQYFACRANSTKPSECRAAAISSSATSTKTNSTSSADRSTRRSGYPRAHSSLSSWRRTRRCFRLTRLPSEKGGAAGAASSDSCRSERQRASLLFRPRLLSP